MLFRSKSRLTKRPGHAAASPAATASIAALSKSAPPDWSTATSITTPAALSAYSVMGLMAAEFLRDYRFGYDLGIVILAYVLGGIFERSVRRALAISDGDLSIFVSTPLSMAFALITVVLVIIAFIPRRVAVAPHKKPAGSAP